MSVETACETVAQVAGRPEFQPTPASLRAMRELALRSQVSAALVTDPRTKDAHLEVSADEGVVTILGTTQSPAVVEAAPFVARRVEGVAKVVSQVRLLREGAPVNA
jgi:osmotically-inducible protein OsmY